VASMGDSALTKLGLMLGDRLFIEAYDRDDYDGEIVRRHVQDLLLLPKNYISRLCNEGLQRVMIQPGSVADVSTYRSMRDTQVPGHIAGTTWSDISAAYDRNRKWLVLGTLGDVGRHIVFHEIGHAAGDLLAYDADFRVQNAYRRMLPQLSTYYRDDEKRSNRGLREFFADSFVCAILSPESLESTFSVEYATFLRDVVLMGRTARAR
jgi:hypothetical protein